MRIEQTYKRNLKKYSKIYMFWLLAERETYRELWEVLKVHLPKEEPLLRFRDAKIYNEGRKIAKYGDRVIKLRFYTIKIID